MNGTWGYSFIVLVLVLVLVLFLLSLRSEYDTKNRPCPVPLSLFVDAPEAVSGTRVCLPNRRPQPADEVPPKGVPLRGSANSSSLALSQFGLSLHTHCSLSLSLGCCSPLLCLVNRVLVHQLSAAVVSGLLATALFAVLRSRS